MAQKSRPNNSGRKSGAAPRAAGTGGQQPRPARQGSMTGTGANQPPRQPAAGGMADRMETNSRRAPASTAPAPVSPLGRQEQRQRARAQQRPRNRGRWAAGGVILVLAVLIAAVLITRSIQPQTALLKGEVQQTPSASGIHVAEGTTIHYDYNPPSSGPHYPSPANWGVYPTALAPGTWVHNLEHGGIVVLYQCPSTCTALQAQMQALYTQMPFDGQFNEKKVIITPYANLDHLVRLQAWGWTLPLDTVDTAAIDAFYHEHVNKGPEVIP